MSKAKVARLAGFTVALGATASLAAFAATGTGAYFTDSHPGTISAATGGVHVNTTDLALKYQNLLPGEFQTNTVRYTATGTGPEDIWLVLPTDASAAAFTGTGGSAAALGRFGHVAISSPAGSFTSYNLASAGAGIHSGNSCAVDGNGHGGSDAQPTTPTDTQVDFCPVPNAILLSSGLTNGQGGAADITFGFTKLLTNGANNAFEDGALTSIAAFKVVATQHGVRPDDPFNG
jgi:hypothetical protein